MEWASLEEFVIRLWLYETWVSIHLDQKQTLLIFPRNPYLESSTFFTTAPPTQPTFLVTYISSRRTKSQWKNREDLRITHYSWCHIESRLNGLSFPLATSFTPFSSQATRPVRRGHTLLFSCHPVYRLHPFANRQSHSRWSIYRKGGKIRLLVTSCIPGFFKWSATSVLATLIPSGIVDRRMVSLHGFNGADDL